jgi:uncharacterized protein with PQ loop repeat
MDIQNLGWDIQDLGWNLKTVGFGGTIFFTLLSCWGLYQQSRKIWHHESGQSVSALWFSYNIFLFAVNIVFGHSQRSFALMINGCLCSLMHLPLLIGLEKFKGFSRLEKLLMVLYGFLFLFMIAMPFKTALYLVFSFGNAFAQCMQPWEIWRKKNSGMVEAKLLMVYWSSSVFWIIYAIATKNLALEIICPVYLVILTVTLALWKKYQVKPASGSS